MAKQKIYENLAGEGKFYGPGNVLNELFLSNTSYYHYDTKFVSFYRAMHFSAKRGIAIACRLSVCLSVTLMDCDHIGWNSSKIISPLVRMGCSLFAIPT